MIVNLDGFDVEIDDAIVDSILELNRKGFKTFTCCSGHPLGEWDNNGYICFENRLLRKFGEPDGWGRDVDLLHEDDEQKYWKQSKRTIRYFLHGTLSEKARRIDGMMKSLKVWVDSLPDLGE